MSLKEFIYLDNAATSFIKPDSVSKAMLEALETCGSAGRGGHAASLNASRTIYKARAAISELMGVKPDRVVFTSNGTQSLNIAIKGLLKPGDHVIATALDHNSVLRPLYQLEDCGVSLSIAQSNKKGTVLYKDIEGLIQKNTRALVCTHASNVTGFLFDIEKLADICATHNLLFILDAAQTAGVYPIDVDKLEIDALCFTGHKGLMGPQGTGGICIGKNVCDIKPLLVGGSGMNSFKKEHPTKLPEALEAGTLNTPGIAGLLAGVKYIQSVGLDAIREKELELAKYFLEGVSRIPEVTVYGDHTLDFAPVVSINILDVDAGKVSDWLSREYGICVRAGTHCAPLAHTALGTGKQGTIRFSFSSFNTFDEIDIALDALKTFVAL